MSSRPTPNDSGVYLEEFSPAIHTITGVPTSTTAFVGPTRRGRANFPTLIRSWSEFQSSFGPRSNTHPLSTAVHHFFTNGGTFAIIVRVTRSSGESLAAYDYFGGSSSGSRRKRRRRGLTTLENTPFNLLCVLPRSWNADLPPGVLAAALDLCERRRAMLLVDPPHAWTDAPTAAMLWRDAPPIRRSAFAAIYFPRLIAPSAAKQGVPHPCPPCGTVAGVFARIDSTRGVWNAPAGNEANLKGITAPAIPITDHDQSTLNESGINTIREFPARGVLIWGARTAATESDWKYAPVRRLANFIQNSIHESTTWAVFEPNDPPLWNRLRLSVETFVHQLFLAGALQGTRPQHAYFVRCGLDTTTQVDIDRGHVNIEVGFAPLRPAEFIILRFAIRAGSITDP